MARTLIDKLAPAVDRLRGLHKRFGTRPYSVWLVRTAWTGAKRGQGREVVVSERLLDPPPRLDGISSIEQYVSGAGVAEQGDIRVSEVSLTLTEADLKPVVAANEQFFIEVRLDEGTRRRYNLTSGPERAAGRVGWEFTMTAQRANRTAAGVPQR